MASKEDSSDRQILETIHKLNLILWSSGFLILNFTGQRDWALGFGAGGLLGSVSFGAMDWLVAKLFTPRAAWQKLLAGSLYFLRIGAVVIALIVAIRLAALQPIALAAGLSTFLVSSVVISIWNVVKEGGREE